ncbi:MAG: hypothetical protein QM803_08150 [Rhodocyclaceae bacterium]
MAEIICIIGTKGGTGKTTLSHLLCHGLSLLGRRTACVMTDEYRDPLPPQGRRYIMADARSPQARVKVVEKLKELPGWMGVLDGGANRTDTDISLYEMSDLVLLPFRDSPEDLRTVMHDLELFPRAFALPSQWPKNKWQQEAAAKLITSMPADMQDRVLSPTYAVSASKLLLQSTPPDSLPAALNSAAKAVAGQVVAILGDDVAAVEASLREAAA